jgi:hypothetical protein
MHITPVALDFEGTAEAIQCHFSPPVNCHPKSALSVDMHLGKERMGNPKRWEEGEVQ